MKFEEDVVTISGGVRHGLSMGSPIALRIGNTEWPKWVDVMSPEPVDVDLSETGRGAPLTRPRPGHADLAGMQKYGFDDARNVLERASARETATRVALGAVARGFLSELGIFALAHTVAVGEVAVPPGSATPRMDSVDSLDADPLRCFDSTISQLMVERVDAAHRDGDTLGGVVEVVVYGLPPGIGSYVHWDRRLDSRLAAALMGIQAIKGVEVGDGFESTRRPGSEAHDEMIAGDVIERVSDRAGGIEGGMSTGQLLRVRAGMKPIATVPHALRTVDTATGEAVGAHHQRSDVCAVPAAGVVAEAMVLLVIAEAVLDKFGGDSISETRRNLDSYLASIPKGLETQRDRG